MKLGRGADRVENSNPLRCRFADFVDKPSALEIIGLHFKFAVRRRPLTPTSFVDNDQIVEGHGAVKLGPVLVRESPAPIFVPIPRHPDRGWGRQYPRWIVALSGSLPSKYVSIARSL